MPGKRSKLAQLTGERLRAFMAEYAAVHQEKFTIRSLARALDVGEDRCGTWVSGRTEIPPYYANRLRMLFGLNTEYLYSEQEDRIKPEYLPLRSLPKRPLRINKITPAP